MTLTRATRKVAVIVTLLAFLSQSVLALGAVHASHPVMPAVGHDTAIDLHRHAASHHYGDTIAVEAMSASDTACDDDHDCLCCIGSCSSVLPGDGAASPTAPIAYSPLFEPGLLSSRDTTTPYRPPNPL